MPRDPSGTMRLTLLRHGQSTYNADGLYQGTSDRPVLTATGRRQVLAAAAMLRRRPFDLVFTSPLKRAAQTAELLWEALPGLPAPEALSTLREISLPAWEGQPFAEIMAQHTDDHRTWKFAPDRFEMSGTDGGHFSPCCDVLGRAAQVIGKLDRIGRGKSVLAVTHGGTIRALLTVLLGLPANRLHTLAQGNCAATVVTRAADGPARLVQFNRSAAPVAEGLERAVSVGRPVFVLTDPGPATMLERRFAFAEVIDGQKAAPDILEWHVPVGPTLIRAPVAAQEILLRHLLGLDCGPAAPPGLVTEGFQIVAARSSAGPATLQVLNGHLPVDPDHHRFEEHTLTEACS